MPIIRQTISATATETCNKVKTKEALTVFLVVVLVVVIGRIDPLAGLLAIHNATMAVMRPLAAVLEMAAGPVFSAAATVVAHEALVMAAAEHAVVAVVLAALAVAVHQEVVLAAEVV